MRRIHEDLSLCEFNAGNVNAHGHLDGEGFGHGSDCNRRIDLGVRWQRDFPLTCDKLQCTDEASRKAFRKKLLRIGDERAIAETRGALPSTCSGGVGSVENLVKPLRWGAGVNLQPSNSWGSVHTRGDSDCGGVLLHSRVID